MLIICASPVTKDVICAVVSEGVRWTRPEEMKLATSVARLALTCGQFTVPSEPVPVLIYESIRAA